jgi:hypothetical protein
MLKLKVPGWRWVSVASVVAIVASTVLVAYSATLVEEFESGVKPSYAAADVTLDTGVWNLSDALIGGDAADRKTGAKAARVRNSGRITMKFNRTTGAGAVTVKHAKYGNDANTSWQLWCSSNNGSSWTQVGSTVNTASTSLQVATFTPNIAGQVRCEIRKTDGSANRTNIDNIQIDDYGISTTPLPSGTGPFFDTVNNPVSGLKYPVGVPTDATPVPPTLDAFDQAVVNVCGTPGKKVSRTEFQTLMANNPTTLASIKTRMGVSSNVSDTTFLNTLTDIWFNAEGFNHVLCGEPVSGGSIGGLHFVGRYLQLQNQGLAGRLDNNASREEIVPGVIYTIGVKMIVNGGTSQSSIKGYGYTLSAEDILAIAGYAYARNPNASSTSQACNLPVSDDGNTFTTIFVAKTNGIRTFYPDATPSSGNPTCAQ